MKSTPRSPAAPEEIQEADGGSIYPQEGGKMSEIKRGVEKFVRNGKEGSQRKKKKQGIIMRNRLPATQELQTHCLQASHHSRFLLIYSIKEEKTMRETWDSKYTYIIKTVNLHIYIYVRVQTTGNHVPTPHKETQLDLCRRSFVQPCITNRYQHKYRSCSALECSQLQGKSILSISNAE